MRTGRLRHRVTLQKPVDQRGSRGEQLERWETVDTVSADILPLRGEELVRAQQLEARLTHRIILRYGLAITPDWRLVFGVREFYPVSVQNVGERNRQYEILAIEGVDASV